jgi:cytochrome b561
MGLTMVGCVGTVLAAQQVKGKQKGNLMFIHKSLGTLAGILLAPRLVIRLASSAKLPAHVPGAQWEILASKVSHAALYAFTVIMPVTGIAMGYFGGKGLPFFVTTIPGAEKANGAIAKQAFGIHKQAGQFLEYLVPVHVGAVAFQFVAKGRNILPRMIGFWK